MQINETGKNSQKDLLIALANNYKIKIPEIKEVLKEKEIYSNGNFLKISEVFLKNSEIYSRINRQDFVQIILLDSSRKIITQLRYRLGSQSFVAELPGGAIEENETPNEAILREVKEELNLDIINISFLGSVYLDPLRSSCKGYFFKAQLNQNFVSFTGKITGEIEESTFFGMNTDDIQNYTSIFSMSSLAAFKLALLN